MPENRRSFRILVDGRVQGVGYRAFVTDAARRHGLDGWVRNRRDGRVEICVSGPGTAVETFIGEALRGPAYARVDDFDLKDAETPAETGFHRRPDA